MKEFRKIFIKRPHVVILGAGATVDAFPDGDKRGKHSALMHNMIDVFDLKSLLSKVDLRTKSTNIEDIYTELFDRGEECENVRAELEEKIRDYFLSMEITDEITKYDHLLLSLRDKDCVASFNWDPLLIQAYNRVNKITDNQPDILFLHGNVFAGICEKCKTFGLIYNYCPSCNDDFRSVPLLYPVKQKDYNESIFIRESWSVFKDYLSRAAIVTIYGYSAPVTDIEASEILMNSFSKYKESHKLDHIEIIERKRFNRANLSEIWNDFISTTRGSYELYDDFYDSLLAEAPRRSVECYFKRYIGGWWGTPKISLSKEVSFETLKHKFYPLFVNESLNNYSEI